MPRTRRHVLFTTASVLSILAGVPNTSAQTVQSALRDQLAGHPRLLLDQAAERKLAALASQDSRVARLRERLLARADAQLELPPMERKLSGRRMLAVSREAVSRIATLALAYRLAGDRKYLAGACDNMLAVAAFEDWNPKHFLDVAEMTTAVAIGYDWLYDDLPSHERETIRRAIIDKGLKPGIPDRRLWWVRARNNWTQVCHGGLIFGALAVAEDEPDLARRIIERAVEVRNLPQAMKDFYAPDGAYPEGMTYWGYGTTYNCLLIAALQSAIGTDLGLLRQPGFLQTSDYRLHLVGPMGLNFSYSDGDATAAASPSAAAFFLARERGDPSLVFNEIRSLDALLDRPVETRSSGEARFEWLLLVWAGPTDEVAPPAATHYAAGGKTPVAVHRSSWNTNATFIAIKGGSPATSHGHVDVGSFCLDADGVRWASDLGSQDYGTLEAARIDIWNMKQDSQRWDIFRYGPGVHNILMVNGRNQVVDGHAPILRSTDHFTLVDLSPVYAGQLAGATRGVMLRPDRTVRMQDELTAPSGEPATVRWAMLTAAEVETAGSVVTLSRAGKTLRMRIVSPAGARFNVISADPPHDYDAPNPNHRLVVFETDLAAGESESLVVDFTPGSAADHDSAGAVPAVVPLEDW